MAGAGKKTFTAGETLTASDVNSYLMEQSVMYFAGTAARSSAIPTPSTGMTSYIGVSGTASIPQLETYTGSAWQTPYGSTLVANVTLSGASAVNIENCFSSAYDNYQIFYSITATTGGPNSTFQLRNSGTTTTTGYSSTVIFALSSATFATRATNGFYAFGQGGGDAATCTISRPFLATSTSWNCVSNQGSAIGIDGGSQNSASSFNSLTWTCTSGTITGTLRIYGLRNS